MLVETPFFFVVHSGYVYAPLPPPFRTSNTACVGCMGETQLYGANRDPSTHAEAKVLCSLVPLGMGRDLHHGTAGCYLERE